MPLSRLFDVNVVQGFKEKSILNTYWELIEFCSNERLDTCADVIDGDYLDGYIMRTIR